CARFARYDGYFVDYW
nr:immunoglobulin heavy chain junction region [Mus musculus]MBK4188671.1 immunoglobulin heavy chain junction region [Mus musculus]MBK4188672.1 immunoglobulin heavy chain junction region [Mus musculus]MBK4188673.1 immunoglobulin heavy chain junction region [Mus musculus]MBK4188674.1 immunoglobulin heavy chain junction region [Mus musculus]